MRFVVILAAGFFYLFSYLYVLCYLDRKRIVLLSYQITTKTNHDENSNNKLDYLQHTCRGCNGW